MPDHATAREEIRKRQRVISHQVIEAGGSAGASIKQFNTALAAAGQEAAP